MDLGSIDRYCLSLICYPICLKIRKGGLQAVAPESKVNEF